MHTRTCSCMHCLNRIVPFARRTSHSSAVISTLSAAVTALPAAVGTPPAAVVLDRLKLSKENGFSDWLT